MTAPELFSAIVMMFLSCMAGTIAALTLYCRQSTSGANDMAIDFSKQLYVETYERSDGTWWKLYRYDVTGNHERIVYKDGPFRDKTDADNDAAEYVERNELDVEFYN